MSNENCKMQNGKMRRAGDDILERLLAFAVRIGKMVDALPETRMGRHIAGQLIRCGTSPAPNYAEACGAESKRDLVHKVGVCLKRTS
jgi:four helix bundle protein